MTLDEALNELGIDREADAEGARRAYLRLLKKRKPEVDRPGFMRLREAYEAVKPYFEQIEFFRTIEKAANTPSTEDGSPQLIRIETPSGTVWVQKSAPSPAAPSESNPDKPATDEPAPAIVEANAPVVPAEEPPVPAMEPVFLQQAFVSPDDVPPRSEIDETLAKPEPAANPQEPAEPSIDDLIEQGKFKKAARLMGAQYRNALQQGTFGVEVSAPYLAITLLLRLHEKNRLEEARALEKDFAEWLASTGSSVRILAGPLGVQWLMARELSALSEKFPPILRESIAKAVNAVKLDEAQRRAAFFEVNDPVKAGQAAAELRKNAPTLANLLAHVLDPPAERRPPAPSSSRGGGGTWGIGFAIVVLLNLFRVLGTSSNDTSSSYRGQTDPNAFYRPSQQQSKKDSYVGSSPPVSSAPFDLERMMRDTTIKFDERTQQKLNQLIQSMEKSAERVAAEQERPFLQRIRYVRVAIERSSCSDAEVEFRGLVQELTSKSLPLKVNLLPIAKQIEAILTPACALKTTNPVTPDGGPNKKP